MISTQGLCECGCGQQTKTKRNKHYRFVHGHNGFTQSADKPMYEVDAQTGCWNWLRALTHDGYGLAYNRITHSNKHQGAHRIIYEQHVGPIPSGMTLDHTCKNRRCVNPAHMDVVTLMVNTQRGKQAKLLLDQARWIKEKYLEGWPLRSLGAEFSVHVNTVSDIIKGRSWRNA